jgi:hypothetical protein
VSMTDLAPPRAARLLHGSIGTCRILLKLLYTAIAMLGALVAPILTISAIPALGAAGAGLYATLEPPWRRPEIRPTDLLAVGLAVGGFAPFVAGVQALGDVGSLFILAVLGLLTAVAAHWLLTFEPSNAAVVPSSSPTGGVESLRDVFRAAPIEWLFEEWRASQHQLTHNGGWAGVLDTASLRGLLLDEMQRRNPTGVERWLNEGAVWPPEHYLRRDDGLAV